MAIYKCKEGYELNGDIKSLCGLDGNWEMVSPPTCLPVSCGAPPVVYGAQVELLNSSTRWQSLCSYHCLPGHYQLGLSLSQCMADGTWSVVSMR